MNKVYLGRELGLQEPHDLSINIRVYPPTKSSECFSLSDSFNLLTANAKLQYI